ncbi:HutD family protein [Paenibacillus filicis]|uniref:HutD family protein n=1 Tax=Paenibacillus gyeongsangnamensis TaxID=3388067 RepID=A0ABT4Q4Q5_9BACL|nr:HutD family protein [Paenibacillus filicis]MCZ8511762.1 HutD family protein [Paenibacillus filicis]
MSYSIKVIKKHEQVVTAWVGGVTTQLAIYPESADYSKRNFCWRISSAEIRTVESLFTRLPDYWRLIMVLDGELLLEYEGFHRVRLKPYERESFSGGWVTRSVGKATDFNLMLGAGCRGELEALHLTKGSVQEIAGRTGLNGILQGTEAFYCTRGLIDVRINDRESLCLEEGDLLLVNRESTDSPLNIVLHNRHDEVTALAVRARVLY